jgi:hypothetical protein
VKSKPALVLFEEPSLDVTPPFMACLGWLMALKPGVRE